MTRLAYGLACLLARLAWTVVILCALVPYITVLALSLLWRAVTPRPEPGVVLAELVETEQGQTERVWN